MMPLFKALSLPVLSNAGVASRLPKCGLCKLDKGCQSPKMKPTGSGGKKILVVAEAPGSEEDRRGVQLVGKSGKELCDTFLHYGIDMRRDCWLTNALICRPPDNKIPDDSMVEWCRPNLIRTVEELKPEVVILLGGRACESLLGWLWKEDVGGVSRWAGYQIPVRKINAWVCPTYHPSYVMRERDTRNPVPGLLFGRHLAAAARLRGRPHPPGTPTSLVDEVEVIYDPDEAARRVLKIQDRTRTAVAFDFETTTLKPEPKWAQVVCCSVCRDGEETICFPWAGGVRRAMTELIVNQDVPKIGSNIEFETRYSRRVLKVRPRGWRWDTMLTGHAIDNASKKRAVTSIKFQAFARLGVEEWDSRVKPYLESVDGTKTGKNRVREVDPETLMRYCGLDSLYEYMVAEHQARQLGVEL